jgi:hypothetical protein
VRSALAEADDEARSQEPDCHILVFHLGHRRDPADLTPHCGMMGQIEQKMVFPDLDLIELGSGLGRGFRYGGRDGRNGVGRRLRRAFLAVDALVLSPDLASRYL